MANPLGSTPGIIVGVGVGTAAAAALEPAIELPRQEAWKRNPNRVLDPGIMARLVAQGGVSLGDATDAAAREGFDADKVQALVYLSQTVPGVGEALRLLRRNPDLAPLFTHALTKQSIDPRYHDALTDLQHEWLTPGELAAAIHRGLVPNPDILLGEQPQPPFTVDAYPVQPIDAVKEGAGSGYSKERLAVLVGLQGLPMGTHEAAEAYFRGIITHGDYIRAFNESNSRNEWAEAVLEYTRQIPTARDFFENALRGYHSLEWAQEQAKRHGMTPDDSLVIYQNQGRPMALSNITKALARGGTFKPEPGELTDPYEAAIVEGNVKPAYYDLAKSLRYTMPSVFAIRSLVQSGVWDAAKGAERLKWSGWLPADADEVAAAWAQPTGSTADTHVAKAQVQLWGTAHSSYVANEITDTAARGALGKAGVAKDAIPEVLSIWQAERDLIRKQLTPAQIKKAFAKATKNYATGQPWTRDDALAALLARGYSVTDANDFLDIPSGGA